MGKSIYLSDYELEFLSTLLEPGNYSCEGSEDEEEKLTAAENIREKVEKALRK
ncbi:hypothetical protein D3C74_324230 [compost metagenome]